MLEIGLRDLIWQCDWDRGLNTADAWLAIEPKNGRARYWKVWCLIGLNRNGDALELAQALVQDSPDDPWGQLAKPIEGALADADARMAGWPAAAKMIEENGKVTGLEAVYHARLEGKPVEAYASIDMIGQRIEAVIQYDRQVLAAYRAAEHEVSYFLKGSEHIQQANIPGSFIWPKGSVDLKGDGKLLLDADYAWRKLDQASMTQLSEAISATSAFKDPKFATAINTQGARRGRLALPAEVAADSITLRLAKPSIDKATLRSETVKLDLNDHGIRFTFLENDELRGEGMILREANYKFQTPKWPDVPVVVSDSLDWTALISDVMAAVKVVKGSVKDKPSATSAELKQFLK